MLPELPPDFATTRDALQRVAAHVVGRRRFAAVGRFGLRATPGGFGTPGFGDAVEVVRIDGAWLVHERDGTVASTPLAGASLAGLAEFVGVDLSTEFTVGHDTPPFGDVDTPLPIDAVSAAALGAWYGFGWRVLDAALGDHAAAKATVIQLWPEHFDAGCAVGERVNLGASPGDGFDADPYLYVGPWGPERPGDDGYWNAPFGAFLGYDDLRAASDPVAAGVEFLLEGLHRTLT